MLNDIQYIFISFSGPCSAVYQAKSQFIDGIQILFNFLPLHLSKVRALRFIDMKLDFIICADREEFEMIVTGFLKKRIVLSKSKNSHNWYYGCFLEIRY